MTTHLTNIFASARLLAVAMTSILLQGILTPTASSSTSDGFANFSDTPFVRPESTITTFDAPCAGTGPGQGTRADNINPAEAIAGRYIDASDVSHGFLRAPDGTITTFDAPNAGTGPGQGTIVFAVDCLNPAGAITATSLDASNVYHGVLRAPDGTMTTFDAPGAGTGPFQGTLTFGINQAGTIEGDYVDASDVSHGFVRASDGTITTFDVPGAGTGAGQGTTPQNISTPGVVPGQYVDASDVSHGFVRAKHGAITTFDVPGAGTGPGQGTIPFCNNPVDAITGVYIDASDVNHGFLRGKPVSRSWYLFSVAVLYTISLTPRFREVRGPCLLPQINTQLKQGVNERIRRRYTHTALAQDA